MNRHKSVVIWAVGGSLAFALLAGCQSKSADTNSSGTAVNIPSKPAATTQQAIDAITSDSHMPPQAKAAIIARLQGKVYVPPAGGGAPTTK